MRFHCERLDRNRVQHLLCLRLSCRLAIRCRGRCLCQCLFRRRCRRVLSSRCRSETWRSRLLRSSLASLLCFPVDWRRRPRIRRRFLQHSPAEQQRSQGRVRRQHHFPCCLARCLRWLCLRRDLEEVARRRRNRRANLKAAAKTCQRSIHAHFPDHRCSPEAERPVESERCQIGTAILHQPRSVVEVQAWCANRQPENFPNC